MIQFQLTAHLEVRSAIAASMEKGQLTAVVSRPQCTTVRSHPFARPFEPSDLLITGELQPGERLFTGADALWMATLHSARAMGLEDRVDGRLVIHDCGLKLEVVKEVV